MEGRLPERERSVSQILNNSHLTEDALEVYSLGQLHAEDQNALVEEHLLVCAYCQTRLEKMDEFHASVKIAAQAVVDRPAEQKPRNYLPIAIAAGLAMVMAVPAILERQAPDPVALDLVATREQTRADAPSSKPLSLRVDLTGLTGTRFDWELVSADGKPMFTGSLQTSATRLKIAALAPGQYWVRLKSPGNNEVLREFSLLVR
jgi:hypothetical protein